MENSQQNNAENTESTMSVDPAPATTSNTQASEATNLITITIKTPKDKEVVQVSPHAAIKELRDEVSKKFAKSTDQLCLIFCGKILKDNETLLQHSIRDGVTVHLVIKSKPVIR
jgi:ubiquilin